MNIHDFKSEFLKLVASNDRSDFKQAAPLYSAGDDETSYQGNHSAAVITFEKE